ncbi:IS21 family transposase, partial [bacterium]|nr:IS21 family transposase [bacterium]
HLQIVNRDTGQISDVEVFVSILGASQYTYAEAVATQQKHDWISANQNAFNYFGGVTRAVVPDCLKTAVSKANQYEPDINPEYEDFSRHFQTVILPARPARPKDKALVENAVKIVYGRVFAPLRDQNYYSLNDLNQAIIEKVEKHNGRFFQRIKISRKQLFKEIEQSVLKPLPSNKYELRCFQSVKVQFNYHVYLSCDKHYYSVPYQYRGKRVKIIYADSTVEIYHKNIRIAFHKRNRSQNKYTTIPEHMPPNHRFYYDWSPEKMIEWAGKKGPCIRELIKNLLEKRTHPEQSYKVCLGVINLSKKYGEGRANRACKRALDFHYYSYKAVKNILEKGLDKIEEAQLFQPELPEHENIRGSEYYR